MARWTERNIDDLTGRRVLVTGAASGLGFEAARALAQHGAEVLLADRNVAGGRAAVARIRASCSGGRVRFLPLDLSSLQSVRAFGSKLVARGQPLDVLINNAGINAIGVRQTSFDGHELTFAIGHLGHYLLTGLLLPLLHAAEAPRVVTVSSLMHGRGRIDWDDLQMQRRYDSQRAYNQTKLANLLFALEFQRRIDAAGGKIRSIAAHPGVARTAIGANRKDLGRFRAADHLVTALLAVVMPVLGQPAAAGALPILYAAVAPQARGGGFYGPDGLGEMKGFPREAVIRPPGRDSAAAERLWRATEEVTGLRYRIPRAG